MRRPHFDKDWPALTKQVYVHDLEEMWEPELRPYVFQWSQRRLNVLVGLIERCVPRSARILEIGCAQATLGMLLAERGYSVVANDIRAEFIDYARMRYEHGDIQFLAGNFLDVVIANRFDLVILGEVIEHLIDHETFLRRIHSTLIPRGLLLLTTPNQEYLPNRLPSFSSVDLRAMPEIEFSADGGDHQYLFTKRELFAMLERSGFDVREHRYFGTFVEQGHAKTRYLRQLVGSRLIGLASRPFEASRRFCSSQYVLASAAP